jgi:hypothetical protein
MTSKLRCCCGGHDASNGHYIRITMRPETTIGIISYRLLVHRDNVGTIAPCLELFVSHIYDSPVRFRRENIAR